MIIEIDVKQHHIDEGIMKDTARCPIALAIDEKFGYEVGIRTTVDQELVVINMNSYTYQCDFDEWHDAYEFIVDFDDGKTVDPTTLTFDMEILQ